jgi:L-cysteine:1D-myo-inositol 2-amino-2-deoxy-alpha-D-glucopyranoside ligase
VLAHHYREDWDWTDAGLSEAEGRLERWTRAAALPAGPGSEAAIGALRAAVADDLDTPGALRAVDRWADEALTLGGRDPDAPARIRSAVDALLGVRLAE